MPDEALERIEQDIAALEAAMRAADGRKAAGLEEVLEPAIALVARTLRAQLAAEGKSGPAEDADVLEVWRALVKGDPTWNAIRDNCRELVFYRNCLALGRTDALPPAPHRMAVRTVRHIFLYVRSRAQGDTRTNR
jgi:hypothetical protein